MIFYDPDHIKGEKACSIHLFTSTIVLVALLFFAVPRAHATELETEIGGYNYNEFNQLDDFYSFGLMDSTLFLKNITNRGIASLESLNVDIDALNIYHFAHGEAILFFSDLPIIDELQEDALTPKVGLGIRLRF